MSREIPLVPALCATALLHLVIATPAGAANWKLISETTVGGFSHPSSVACDRNHEEVYVTDYGPDLEPTAANDRGAIVKMSSKGRILDRNDLAQPGEAFHRPRGLHIYGSHLWMADLDSVWEFNLSTKMGKKLKLPGLSLADHVTQDYAGQIYVSDSRADRIERVAPGGFLDSWLPSKVTTVYSGGGIHPEGVYPGRRGGLFMVGFLGKNQPSGIYFMKYSRDIEDEDTMLKPAEPFSEKIGMLDGIAWLSNDEILLTDWSTGSLLLWTSSHGVETLATGFKGPTEVCWSLRPMNKREMLVAVPDLIKGEVRLMWFSIGDTVLSY